MRKLRNFRPHNAGSTLINSYGMTETSGTLSKRIRGDEARITVGKPWVNTKACLVDEAQNPVPPGEAGELLLSSDFMARAYYRQPELSAQKWIRKDGTLWFRTGSG